MEAIPTWVSMAVDGGAIVVLAAVIYVIGQFFIKQSQDAIKFAQEQATKSMERMDELADKAVDAQITSAKYIAALTDRVENGQKNADVHYERTSREHSDMMAKVGLKVE